MEINNYTKANVTVLVLDGNLDGTTVEYAQEKIIKHVVSNCKMVIDMTKCCYVSSAGLRVLLMTAKQLIKVGGIGVLAGLAEEVNDVMEMTGFSSMFDSYSTIEDAIAAVGKE